MELFSRVKVQAVNSIQLTADHGDLMASALISDGEFGGIQINVGSNAVNIKSAGEAKTLRDLISQTLAHA